MPLWMNCPNRLAWARPKSFGKRRVLGAVSKIIARCSDSALDNAKTAKAAE